MTHLRCLAKPEAPDLELEDREKLTSKGAMLNGWVLISAAYRKFAFWFSFKYVYMNRNIMYHILQN